MVKKHPENESRGFIGIGNLSNVYKFRFSGKIVPKEIIVFVAHILNFFNWMVMLSLGVGMANLLPINPLGGGKMWEDVFVKINKKHGKKISRFVSILFLFILLFSLFGISIVKAFS